MSDKLPKGWNRCECGCRVPPGKKCPICYSDDEEKRVAIAIDKWKLSVFSKELEKQRFAFVQLPGPTSDTLILKVVTDDVARLKSVVEVCQSRCWTLRN